jgi:uncharacterized protein with PQ loop repeat
MTRWHRHQRLKSNRTLAVSKKPRPLFIDRLTFSVAVIEPIILGPQIYRIFKFHNAVSISISAWVGFEIFCLVWLWYGFVHKDKMIITYQGLYLIANSLVIIGAMKYGGKFF